MLIDLEKHYYIVNNINGEKLRSMVEDKIDQCNIVLDEALRTGDDNLYSKTLSESHAFFQVLRMIFDLSLEVDKVQTEDKAEPEEVPAEAEDKAEPEEVPAEAEDKAEPEEVPAQTEDKFSIYCFYEDGYRVAFPVRDNFYNYGLILHMYSNRFEFSNSELSSSTVLNVFNLDNNIHGDILSICICPTVFDPEYTEPEEVPAEDEDEAEPEQVLSNKKCFSNAHCCTSDCPNIRFDIAENRFGYGIAEDMGFERISCKECYYNTGKCEDCLFFNGSECLMSSDPDPHVYHGLDEIPF